VLARSPSSFCLVNWPDESARNAKTRSDVRHSGGLRVRESPAPFYLTITLISNKYTKKRGAQVIRTPDLLHAIQAPAVAERGRASPYGSFTCDNPGSMWPDVARRLPTLAPDLAPGKLVSSANVRWIEQAVGPPPPPKSAADDPPRPSPWSTRFSFGPHTEPGNTMHPRFVDSLLRY
jgi:hypothetical protein